MYIHTELSLQKRPKKIYYDNYVRPHDFNTARLDVPASDQLQYSPELNDRLHFQKRLHIFKVCDDADVVIQYTYHEEKTEIMHQRQR